MSTNKQFRVYKTNSQITGTALSIDFNLEKKSAFLDFAKQKDASSYDWQNKITIKLSPLEMAKINVFKTGAVPEITLFHDPSKGEYNSDFQNAVLKVSKFGSGYAFKLNQKEKTGNLISVQVSLTEEEFYIVSKLFDKFIEKNYFD